MKLTQKTALITGASSGLGYEFAKLFAKAGYNLILVARRTDRLETIQAELSQNTAISIKIITIDLAEPNAAQQLVQKIQSEAIHVLINNAGFGNFDSFVNIDLIQDYRLLQLNIIALTELTKLCLPNMLQQNEGKILNVASIAAFQPGPYMATYFASKAYVLSFSQALAHELKDSGITVTCLCPGPTETEFHFHAKMESSTFFQANMMSAKKVAEIGYHAMMKGQWVIIPGIINKILIFATRLVPSWISTKISGFLISKRQSKIK